MSENSNSFTWTIHNFNCCWQKNGEAIVSPMFKIYMPEQTIWRLQFFPRGVTSINDYSALFLYRDQNCSGAEIISVEYKLDILKTDGSCQTSLSSREKFRKRMRWGFADYSDIERFESHYSQQDILMIRCTITRLDQITDKVQHIFARTFIGVEKRFFQWPIKNFSDLAPNEIRVFEITSESKKIMMYVKLALSNDSIWLGIDFFDQGMKFAAMKTFIINTRKQKVYFGEYKLWPTCEKNTIFNLKLTKKSVMENESLYLTNNVLTLSFEFTYSYGVSFEGIEMDAYEYTSQLFLNEMAENWRKCVTHKNLQNCPCSLITDLTSLYRDQSTCDMKLQTKTNTFLVHTSILSARSPVFRAMFSSDMKEKLNGCVDISDLEDRTVDRFLLYLYSNQLEDLTWDDALQLYKAADKYAVISLREKCSTFLKSNLNPENVCEALVLSDMHNDKKFKEITQNIILRNAKTIFKSEEWKVLGEHYSKLALEISKLV